MVCVYFCNAYGCLSEIYKIQEQISLKISVVVITHDKSN